MAENHTHDEMEQRIHNLEESWLMYQSVFDHLPDHIVIQGREHRIFYTNQAAGLSLNANQSELVGRRFYELWALQNGPCPDCQMPKAIELKLQIEV